MASEFYLTVDQADRRIDRYLRTRYPHIPLGAIMKALRKGDVRLDAKKVSPNTRLEEGQLLQVPWDDKARWQALMIEGDWSKKNELALDTIYKDENVWIVNKPAGLLTQPDSKGGDSVITRVLAKLRWNRRDFRPAPVQRLDRNTSGLVLIAMSGWSQRYLSELIRERQIKKIYWAIVAGNIQRNGRADYPLLKDPASNMVEVDKRGRKSLTIYRKIKGNGKISAVELELVTGRPHQARAHMSALGHPILGDVKYGCVFKGITRTMLHARLIKFPDDPALPRDVRGNTFTADLPKDMDKVLRAL